MPVEQSANNLLVLTKPKDIRMFQLLAQRGALKLEILGMKRHGRSMYSIIKEHYGFKGNKQKVLEQFESYIDGYRVQEELDI